MCPGCAPKRQRRRKRLKKVASSRRKDWNQDAISEGLGIPDEEFDYEDFIQREFASKPHRRIGIKWYWWATAAGLAGLLGWTAIRGLF